MKKFFNVQTLVMSLLFIAGFIASAIAENAVACIWIFTGHIWVNIARLRELETENLREEYEVKLTQLRHNRDSYMRSYNEYMSKYDAKLEENLRLARDNKQLTEDLLRLTSSNSDATETAVKTEGQTNATPSTVSSNKQKRKKKKTSTVKASVQNKAE